MQHVTSHRKVEGQDIVESIHPAPSSAHLRKDGREYKEGRKRKKKMSATVWIYQVNHYSLRSLLGLRVAQRCAFWESR